MYYPYFYAQRVELASVCEVAASTSANSKITPILEPAVKSPGDLSRSIDALASGGAATYLILNPNLGDFKTAGNVKPWLDSIQKNPNFTKVIIPTFLIDKGLAIIDLEQFLKRYSGEIGIVIRYPSIPSDVLANKLADRIAAKQVIVFLHQRSNPQQYESTLGKKNTIQIVESFNVQPTNADYSDPEWLTSGHLSFKTEGRHGFSDFAVLRPGLAGGWTPPVVVSHMTYEQTDKSLWVQHFLSAKPPIPDAKASDKILEVAQKIETEKERFPQKFVRTPGIVGYETILLNGKHTSLSKNKQFQVTHHLFTVANLI
ncbi:sce7725 family protein [Mycobacteroides chelonae]|uniref:sce7725 family protein n=1 Tax=Mycobacteroides chelonae TaxID=1774 RepID=UPI0012FFC48C|nr:sce7725 family protein [Mycobacteroides chelonae]MBF9329405.1 sce7725 family protein [Mycobacteroides chelonae]MBF9424128.1 sce7725 family protein [Mycobacteroides chelonae]MBF9437732.1 sce7725 family protein [Mycobacteroides chelonae]MBV6359030.1 sce7725 family protein [Mycobacteroides chelonae]MEC4835360.1 sce7725 family protein [Mycobacteroides chelonae]